MCDSSIKDANVPYTLTENMFCAGLQEGGKDTCQGDSGSGFVMRSGDVYYAAGIVSWGVNCGEAGRYGVYTHIARYSNWIYNIMQEKHTSKRK